MGDRYLGKLSIPELEKLCQKEIIFDQTQECEDKLVFDPLQNETEKFISAKVFVGSLLVLATAHYMPAKMRMCRLAMGALYGYHLS